MNKKTRGCKHEWNTLLEGSINKGKDKFVVNKCKKCGEMRRQDYMNNKLIKTTYMEKGSVK